MKRIKDKRKKGTMKLIELLYYLEKYIPIRITTEDKGLEIICYTEELEEILEEEEKKIENLKRIVLEQEIKKIDYNGEQERIEIILNIY